MSLDENLERTCEVCGAILNRQEIDAAHEAGPPFLCSKHMAEELPTEETEAPDEPPEGSAGGPPAAA